MGLNFEYNVMLKSDNNIMASSDRLLQTRKQVDEVVDIMKTNVERINERGENLQNLEEKANKLEMSASKFQTTSGKVKRKMWWKNLKMMLILGAVVIAVIVIIILATVPMGGSSSSDGGGNNPTNAPDTDAEDRAKRSLSDEPQQMASLLLNLIAN
ncbi:unnamed protein product, partial [Meganyctiphanes norvegica]